jgi:hypothetical protein
MGCSWERERNTTWALCAVSCIAIAARKFIYKLIMDKLKGILDEYGKVAIYFYCSREKLKRKTRNKRKT